MIIIKIMMVVTFGWREREAVGSYLGCWKYLYLDLGSVIIY